MSEEGGGGREQVPDDVVRRVRQTLVGITESELERILASYSTLRETADKLDAASRSTQ
jgi:hypothetical protein